MIKRSLFSAVLLLFLVSCFISKPAYSLTEEENKKILKDAVQGAITGAVAAGASQEDPKTNFSPANKKQEFESHKHSDHDDDDDDDDQWEGKHHKHKKGHRPPGWDKGKKVGWGGADEPPGLHKKD